jgi:hypothetical protein
VWLLPATLPDAGDLTNSSWEGVLGKRDNVHPRFGRATDLAFQRHVVYLRVQEHCARTEGHCLVGNGPGCPAMNPQDLLLAGHN